MVLYYRGGEIVIGLQQGGDITNSIGKYNCAPTLLACVPRADVVRSHMKFNGLAKTDKDDKCEGC